MSEAVHDTKYDEPGEFSDREADLEEIRRIRLRDDPSLAGLFEDDNTDDELLSIYGKWQVIRSLGLEISDEKLKIICTKGVRGLNFEQSITKHAHGVYRTAASFKPCDVEVTAAFLGVFDYIWPSKDEKS